MHVKDMTFISLSTAIIAVLGFFPPIVLPFTPVPITLQTLGVMLAGGINKPKNAGLSLIVFLLLVASGMPLLSGGRGGIGVFTSPSAGFLLAYPAAAFCIALAVGRLSILRFRNIFFIHLLFGILFIYAIGIPVQAFLMQIDFITALRYSLVYVPGDLLKSAAAAYLVLKLRKALQIRDAGN
ncbi:biotin transporter BioY [Bacillus swezeyi]|uniref:Biotin transporter n=1 Tax=Bacillus swezeyi TaxID=1925020 RepID=A0A1R1RWA1_9BACI|nr:biotin transporter BioY [Bacillus swezeyi]MEC1261656.1 biotin transporter BioY [Bacillus swezeyi]MED1738314.1 biotin transporter BioY [Bacillus swezeyi]MED2926481.1 biotin transporter BioY [Bacillus swezeyi]MED2943950.1 biotin transporter BioY [Bacillus swezeyi]MED2965956.1 biotin transporter BioY [Bacillus swezeyi]